MKKVGIVTINDYGNYGNRLQNYALQEVIKNLGFDVTTIVNTPSVSVKDRLKNEKLKGALYVFSRVPQITRFIFKKKNWLRLCFFISRFFIIFIVQNRICSFIILVMT